MEDEIDLREYVRMLMRHWRLVVSLAVVAAGVAFAVSSFLPKRYEASAIVAITRPRYTLQFDPRIQTVDNLQTNAKAYLGLATSDDLLMKLLEAPAVAPLIDGTQTLADLSQRVKAGSGADPSLVELKVSDTDPARAANIANTWAELYVTYVSEVYGQAQSDKTFFEAEVVKAEARLRRAEADLVAYQAANPTNIINAALDSKLEALAGYLSAQQSLALVIQDAASLRARLGAQNPETQTSLGDDLAALLVEINSLSSLVSRAGSQSDRSPLPIQLQLPADAASVTGKTVSEQIAYLDKLADALRTKSEELQAAADALQPGILSLQEQLAKAQTEEARLKQEQGLAEEAYTLVARKAEEARISAASGSSDVRLASRASAPTVPVSPRRMLNTGIAGAMGLMVSVFAVYVWEWWRGAKPEVASVMAADRDLPVMTGEYPGESAKPVAEAGPSRHSG